MKYWFGGLGAILSAVFLTGCIWLAVPVAGLGNLAHKSGTMEIELQGAGGIPAFKRAAIAERCAVPIERNDFARAECVDVDMRVDAQLNGSNNIQILGASLSNVGRTYATEDSITIRTQAIADHMAAAGFTIVSSNRKRF